MTVRSTTIAPVVPTPSAAVRLRPIGLGGIRVVGGLWAERRQANRSLTIPHGLRQLEMAGNLDNLRAVARGSGTYAGDADDAGLTFRFLDSDVYKWLEAVGWELAVEADAELARAADDAIAVVEAAQAPDGYLNSYFQLVTPGRQFHDMEWGHELYTFGHLAQAAIAWRRGLGDDRLLAVAQRMARRIDDALGPSGAELIDGHPGAEMALIELFRLTGDDRLLRLAAALIERRGRGLLRADRFGPDYWQDHAPARSAPEPVGHAVRQLYLDCGVVDLAVETGDAELLDAARARWAAMVASRTYLTGGVGARQRDEAFGAPFELPPDAAYAETCAAIASVMLAWRLLLATGEAHYADLIERTSLNAILPGLSLDGVHFLYANPLQVRSGAAAPRGPTSTRRQAWYACACCPPNVMRFLSSFPDMVATTDAEGLSVHQLTDGSIGADASFGRVGLRLATAYPGQGEIDVEVDETPGVEWAMRIRVPAWCTGGTLAVADDATRQIDPGPGELVVRRRWQAGDRLRIKLDMPPRITMPDPRIDAVRGTVAVERGPLVYAFEERDLPDGTSLEALELDTSQPPTLKRDTSEFGGLPVVEVMGHAIRVQAGAWPYPTDDGAMSFPRGDAVRLRAVPYLAWGNRGPGAMRVWVPAAR